MNLDPQKFFIGLMDFFSILLPGALPTYLLMDEVGPVVLGDRYARFDGAQAWAAFLFASYLFGHLVFLLGSWLDEFYDWAHRYTLNAQIALLARRGHLLPWLARTLIWLVFKGERNLAVDRAAKIKQQALSTLQAKDAINTFQWSKAWLNAQSPASLAVVQRFEADSKFFRCFTIVLLLLLLVAWPWQHHWPLSGIAVVLVLLLLSLWRYMEQRHKATNQAYWSVITLTAKDGKVARLDNYNQWMQAEREFRLCGSLRVALRETKTLAGHLAGAVSTKDWDALLQQMQTILTTEGEVALFIGQQFQQLANDARSAVQDNQHTSAVRDALSAFRAALVAERQELIKQELALYEIV